MTKKKQVAISDEYHKWLRMKSAVAGVSQGAVIERLIKEEQSREKAMIKAETG
jgi:hypothetical protein